MKTRNIVLLFSLFFSLFFYSSLKIYPDTLHLSSFIPELRYAYSERENMRVYVNDRYSGLQNRERRVYLEKVESTTDSIYHGTVYLFKKLNRDAVTISQPVDTSRNIQCRIDHTGMRNTGDETLPVRVSFPVLPDEEMEVGTTWQADGQDAIYTYETTISTPFHCTYEYNGDSVVMGRPAQLISFSYTYYDNNPYKNEPTEIRGRGEGEIALFLDDNAGFFINERIIRHFLNANQKVERREEGFRLTWGRGISRGEVQQLEQKVASLLDATEKKRKDAAHANKVEGGEERAEQGPAESGETEDRQGVIEVTRTAEGIKLNLPYIHFYPDEARILPSEKPRLDRLAEVLSQLPTADFLVKGHTADVGSRESQYVLSVERAKTIIGEMVKRGLATDRFIFQGVGGDEPVASNDTEEGRRKNRRVEVVILEKPSHSMQ